MMFYRVYLCSQKPLNPPTLRHPLFHGRVDDDLLLSTLYIDLM